MSHIPNRHVLAAVILLTLAAAIPSQGQSSGAQPTAPDSTLFTNYTASPTSVNWVVCGSTANTEGCYASGSLGPFVGVGAMLESNAFVKSNVVTRKIFVVDSGSANNVQLYVYQKTDTVTAESDTVVVTLQRTVSLPLTGGSSALCSMAANDKFLFIGTDQSELAAMVQKSNFAVTEVGDIDAPGVTSITADQYGYVTVTLGSSGFTVFGPNGEAEEDGGGGNFMLGTIQALPFSTLPDPGAQPILQRGYRPKTSHPQADPK